MKKQTEWKHYREGVDRFRIQAEYGMTKFQGQAAYFGITASIDRQARNNRWVEDSGGMLHEDIARRFPKLGPYLKWHLVSTEQPMHYLANAKYWWEIATGQKERREYDPDPVAAFQSTIIMGGVRGDEMPPPGTSWDDIEAWLRNRLPALMDNFHAAMKELGVL